MRPTQAPCPGWETGRPSDAFNMDMNLHSVRGDSEPAVVLYQYDEHQPMNPKGLLVAYAETEVKPVVSDFDTFTVGSTNTQYSRAIPENQANIMTWSLKHTRGVLEDVNAKSWTSSWQQILRNEHLHPEFPKYGFGDPTSYELIGDVVEKTSSAGAIRHGAECFNFYFPQELDDEYLVVWKGYEAGWEYLSEPLLRTFLIERAEQGFFFPLNPVWPVRDKGWYDVFQALRRNAAANECLAAWYPPGSGILEMVEELHKAFPDGFCPKKS